MLNFIYPATIEKDDGGFFMVKFVDIDRAATDGKSLEDALMEAEDCLEEAIAMRIFHRMEIPLPSEIKPGQFPIPLSAGMAAKAALYMVFRETGLTQNEFADKIGVDAKEARRMLSPKHKTKITRIEKALEVFGRRIFLSMATAA